MRTNSTVIEGKMEEKSNGRREQTYKEMYVRKNRTVDGVKKTG